MVGIFEFLAGIAESRNQLVCGCPYFIRRNSGGFILGNFVRQSFGGFAFFFFRHIITIIIAFSAGFCQPIKCIYHVVPAEAIPQKLFGEKFWRAGIAF